MSNLYQVYYELREKRLALQREADVLEQKEKDIVYELTKGLDNDGFTTFLDSQEGFRFQAEGKPAASVKDWVSLLAHIKLTGELDLLQKRVTESAVKQRWDNGLTVPGVEKINKWVVKVTKES